MVAMMLADQKHFIETSYTQCLAVTFCLASSDALMKPCLAFTQPESPNVTYISPNYFGDHVENESLNLTE